jgi:two-component system phosphate regulon sensor histidine kinase PhoR
VISQESERLTRIVGDILLANQIEAGRLKFKQREVDLAVIAQEAIDEIRAALAARDDIDFELAAPESMVVYGDGDKLRQVLLNLIDNAVKYSPAGGRIEVFLEPHGTGVRMNVRDEGIGIPDGELKRIFGKFYRVDPQQIRGVGGTGLGLYICRELVRRMDGRLSVTSAEGKGSTFVVDLPLRQIRPPEQAVVSQSA